MTFAQSRLPELDKIKQIKLLESTRNDVKRIFGDPNNDLNRDTYATENMYIRFFYASGDCTDEEEEWNVPEEKVTEIHVIFKGTEKSQSLKVNLSNLERIKADEEDEDDDVYVYYDKQKGIYYTVFKGKIGSIKFMPSDKESSSLCNNNNFRQFNLDSEWFRNKLRDRPFVTVGRTRYVNVDDLILSREEITFECSSNDSTKVQIYTDNAEIEVETKVVDAEPDDVLVYQYKVSGGKIIGSGERVIWDLTGVKPGKYTITVGADSGCGICGQTKTKEVIVKEPNCKQK